MAVKNIDVCFNLVDNFSKNFEKSISALNNGSKSAQRAWKQVGKAGDSIANIGKGLTAAVTTPIVGLGVTAVKEFGSVDKSMQLVKATMGDAAWQTGDLTGAMKEAAANSVYGMQDAADACINFARQGFNAKQAADMINGAMALSSGTATDLSEVTGGLGNTMKIFGYNTKDAAWVADTFAKAQASANTTTSDLIESMSIAGPIAKSVGWEVDDLSTYTAAFGNAGISGSEGATALKTGLARLAAPAKDGSIWMEKLGLNIFDANGKMASAVDVQEQLHKSFPKLTQEQQLSAAAAIFGKNQMSKWLAIINQSPDDFKKLNSTIGDCTGAAQSMSDALLSGVGGSFEKLQSSFDVMKYNIGETIGGVIKPFVDKITELIDKFNALSPAQQQQIEKWALMAAAAGPAIWAFGKTVTGISNIGVALNGLALAGVKLAPSLKGASMITKVFGGVLAGITSPTAIVIGVLAGLIAVSILVWKNWDKITAAFDKAKPKLTPIINLFKSLARVAEAVWGAIKRFASGFAKGFTKNVDMSGMISGFKKGINTIKETVKPLIPVISNVFNKLAGFIRKHGPEIRAFGTVVGTVVGKIVTVVGNGLGVAFQIAGKVISVSIKACVAAIKGFATYAGPIINGFKKILNSLITFITGVFTGNWGKAWQGVVDLFKSIFETVVSIAKGVVNGVASAINTVIGAINGINFKVPDWVPGVGGKSFSVNIPKIPALAKGSENWQGGIAQVSEKGGEIIDLPKGSRVYPHDKSVEMARGENRQRNVTINIPKLADQITVREDADIDKIIDGLTRRLQQVSKNVGTVGAMA
jgi:TP901 family phage tail tape measure protein